MSIDPAVAAKAYLGGVSDSYAEDALACFFRNKAHAPQIVGDLAADVEAAPALRNTRFGTARRGPQPQDASPVLATTAPSPSLNALSGVHARADALYGHKLTAIAAEMRHEFSGTAPGVVRSVVAPTTPAREIIAAAPAATGKTYTPSVAEVPAIEIA